MCFYQNIDSCSLYRSNLIIKRRKKIGKFIFWHKIPTAPITVLRWWWYNTYTSNYYYVLQSNITAASWGRIQFIQNISHTIDIDIQLQKYLPIKYKDCRKTLNGKSIVEKLKHRRSEMHLTSHILLLYNCKFFQMQTCELHYFDNGGSPSLY